MSITDNFGNLSTATGAFVTASAPIVLSGNITETGAATLTGSSISAGSSLGLNGSTIVVNRDPSDTNSLTGSLTLSGVTSITVSGSTWNGVLLPPTLIQSGATENATTAELSSLLPSDTFTTAYSSTILQTVKAGAEGTSLIASGSYFALSFLVASGSTGDTIQLYRSNDGVSWEVNTPDASCVLGANKMCSFRTNHLSYFSNVKISSVALPQVNIGGGGGGGGGGLARDFCPSGDYSASNYDGSCVAASTSKIVSSGSTTQTKVVVQKTEGFSLSSPLLSDKAGISDEGKKYILAMLINPIEKKIVEKSKNRPTKQKYYYQQVSQYF